MKQLESADVDEPGVSALIDELATVLSDTSRTKRASNFPKLRQAIPRDQMVALADKVQTAKKAAPTRPHPSSPNSELFHKSVGPASG